MRTRRLLVSSCRLLYVERLEVGAANSYESAVPNLELHGTPTGAVDGEILNKKT